MGLNSRSALLALDPSSTIFGVSRRSTATVRARPVPPVAAAAGPLLVHGETLVVETAARVEVVDLTDRVMALVGRQQVAEGMVHLVSLHTTCTVIINEFQPALLVDFKTFLETLVPEDARWRHNDPVHSDCDRQNAEAHLRAMLLGHGLALQVSGGEVVLGQWQRVLLAELDGPRARTVRVQIMGVGAGAPGV
jgi:secondary thiamine-phosphate synthase enzyme